ncbi:hypothetical protein [Chryseobacterium sp.]|uniref:hypothetical protein n=1 Tax=Chryseobacterium sp. TaxID=1871047 RepID=UPI002FC8C0A6
MKELFMWYSEDDDEGNYISFNLSLYVVDDRKIIDNFHMRDEVLKAPENCPNISREDYAKMAQYDEKYKVNEFWEFIQKHFGEIGQSFIAVTLELPSIRVTGYLTTPETVILFRTLDMVKRKVEIFDYEYMENILHEKYEFVPESIDELIKRYYLLQDIYNRILEGKEVNDLDRSIKKVYEQKISRFNVWDNFMQKDRLERMFHNNKDKFYEEIAIYKQTLKIIYERNLEYSDAFVCRMEKTCK